MRGRTRISLPRSEGKETKFEPDKSGHDRRVIEMITERGDRARSMTESSHAAIRKSLSETQRTLDNSMKEWTLLKQGDAGDAGSGLIAARRTHLLKSISDMRKRINSQASLLYCHEFHNGGECLERVGKHGYPDLNNQSAIVMAFQRIGIPLLFDDLSQMADGPVTEETLENKELLRMLGMFRPLGVHGRRYSFTLNSTRDEVTVSVVGILVPDSSGPLLDRFGPDLKGLEDFRTIVERPTGSGERYIATDIGDGSIIQLDPLDQDPSRQSKAMPTNELLTEISEGRCALKASSKSGPLAHRRTALHVIMSVLEGGGPVLIELEDEGGRTAREYIVDDLDMASRKMVIIDPLKPRGVSKTLQFYGGDLDRVLERWGKRDYAVTTFGRKVLTTQTG